MGFELVRRSPLNSVQIPAKANSERSSLSANHTMSFLPVAGFVSGAFFKRPRLLCDGFFHGGPARSRRSLQAPAAGGAGQPGTVKLHLAQAKCRLFPDIDRPTIYREYGLKDGQA